MQFLDDSLLPENQQPLIIQVAPYGPEFLPGDSDDIPVTMAEQVKKAVEGADAKWLNDDTRLRGAPLRLAA